MVEAEAETQLAGPVPRDERVLFALRQAGLLALSLLIAGLVTERLRPEETLDRGIASTPFLWAIVLWFIALLINALAFERSQMTRLEGTPLYVGLVAGAFVLVTGVIGLEGGSLGRRAVYIIANSLGAVMFWWALASIVALVVRRLAADTT